MEKLLEHLGFATPFIYGAAAYGLFHWLDENASDDAKAALARTMALKEYRSTEVAPALIEVFDRLYTFPLLQWRAFVRSALFTSILSLAWIFELWGFNHNPVLTPRGAYLTALSFVFNVATDYLSLFVIRPLLRRAGMKPVSSLVAGALSAIAIVALANELRAIFLFRVMFHSPWSQFLGPLDSLADTLQNLFEVGLFFSKFSIPALMVFAWLPLFALGILIIRALTPLEWLVGKAQWILKDGKQHPLKAVGYVAALIVFFVTVGRQAIVKV